MSEVFTFGCRLNFYESEIIKKNLKVANLKDVTVVHSCAVTNEAERQVKHKIRELYKNNSDIKIIVAGCAAQLNPEVYANMPGVIKVLGNVDKLQYESYINDNIVSVSNVDNVGWSKFHELTKFADKARAFIEIQNGCNHQCTFCVITKARGNNRSMLVHDIVNQVKVFVEHGYNEIVFTGVDITDFGLDIFGKPSLGMMVKRVLKSVPELQRLRLSSIDIAEIDEDLFDVIESEPRFMPHLHMSLQSGNDIILKRMKRRHSRNQALEFCDKVRSLRKDVVFGADIIVGFPTETDSMFCDTIDLIERANISYLHVFPYSKNEGTVAARMPQVAMHVKKERAKHLRDLGKKRLNILYNTLLNTTQSVVVEKAGLGRAENFALVKFYNRDVSLRSVIDVQISGIEGNYLISNLAI
ncbi:tRNA (N(6)-L-threonylcarbamoyladenosine(37)-C(2))-methylthiotransferase MtaB [Candidatus Neoehrlichia procyonis]|uniref:Radical SAM methylthiotransferase, MiaB/RimO family protein n=1 Tax=Candidatus Neoehrlichia procyonis str. RAC413 TaxID=1359163 RepID=A0A0F3NND6_9RICK|nr:tRNA (N(6)-L-threonylcarbamoyladenosine(37)-C(2))-methylthiotransferase MtaB [Candidatus Neoehrlichia lotoris]KJV69212.1 radical SAM methylthiotransferase, MiaB/RimO family protein [Candidatus Neoehrlichia lotoris str. RAC413]